MNFAVNFGRTGQSLDIRGKCPKLHSHMFSHLTHKNVAENKTSFTSSFILTANNPCWWDTDLAGMFAQSLNT